VRRYAAAVALDPDTVRFEWDGATSLEGMGRIEVVMKETLLKSKGLVLEKLARVEELDVKMLKEKWKEEFGEELGGRVGALVDNAREDYEWLWERRMKV
jgi:hypothetical protein